MFLRGSRHLGDSPRAAADSFQSRRRRPPESLVDAATSNSFGSPLWTDQVGTATGFTSPTFATIDGVRAIVAASLNGEVYVVNAITGTALPGWPQKAEISGSTPTAMGSSPTVAYLDGASQPPTIIVGAGSQSVPYQNGGVIAFYATGRSSLRLPHQGHLRPVERRQERQLGLCHARGRRHPG